MKGTLDIYWSMFTDWFGGVADLGRDVFYLAWLLAVLVVGFGRNASLKLVGFIFLGHTVGVEIPNYSTIMVNLIYVFVGCALFLRVSVMALGAADK